MNLRHRPAIALLCLPLLLTGCSGDDEEPEAGPPATSAAATTPSGTPGPEPWEERSESGAQAFVERWVGTFNEAKATGDTKELRNLSSENCKSCENYVEYIEELYAGGGSFESEGWAVKRSLVELDANRAFVTTRVIQSPESVTRPAPGESEEFPGGPLTLSATLRWTNQHWVMVRLDLL